jgi:hypothetical protein
VSPGARAEQPPGSSLSRVGQIFALQSLHGSIHHHLVVGSLSGGPPTTWQLANLRTGACILVTDDLLSAYQARGSLLSEAPAELPPHDGAG